MEAIGNSAFADEFLGRLPAQLGDHEARPTMELSESDIELSRIPRDIVDRLNGQADLDLTGLIALMNRVIDQAYSRMSSCGCKASLFWRKLYTDASVVGVLLRLSDSKLLEAAARTSIEMLDRAIILAGAPGDASLGLILDMIRWIQSHTHWQVHELERGEFSAGREVVPKLSTSLGNVPCISLPSLTAFQTTRSRSPFVLKGFVSDWPAVKHWISIDYLSSMAGPGRIVPMEVGDDYRSDDWTQELLDWDVFLSILTHSGRSQDPLLTFYLAQHNLLRQFPALREDIAIPDYVYMSPGPSASYPNYRPPSNEDQLVINAWFGPKGTISPAHTDPFFNCYAQVVGRKTVWLAPPEVTPLMYSYGPSLAGTDEIHHPAANSTEPLMSNTSRVDVFPVSKEVQEASRNKYPAFWNTVPEKALSVTLEPGDLLFFPPGWWHAMRSEDVSFSVSMWF